MYRRPAIGEVAPLALPASCLLAWAQTICKDLDGQPAARPEHGIIRLLAFDYGYFRSHFYFRIHYLVKRKKRKSADEEGIFRCSVEIF
jgi:hypothetical protein